MTSGNQQIAMQNPFADQLQWNPGITQQALNDRQLFAAYLAVNAGKEEYEKKQTNETQLLLLLEDV